MGQVRVGIAAQGRVAADGVQGHAHATVTPVRPSVAVAGHHDDDEVGPDPAKRVVVEAEGVEDAIGVVAYDHVAEVGQPGEALGAAGAGEVQGYAQLAPVHAVEGRLPVPGPLSRIALRVAWRRATRVYGAPSDPLERLDLDHLRAEVAEKGGAEGRRPYLGQLQHTRALEDRVSVVVAADGHIPRRSPGTVDPISGTL